MSIEMQAKERRTHDRRSCDLFASCYPLTDSGRVRWTGRITDISSGGVRLVVPRWFEEGTILKIHVEETGEDVPLTLFGRVLHVSPQSEGAWALGCYVSPNVEEQDLETMLQECMR